MNLTRSALSFAGGMLIARWLGPSQFGDYAFLIGTFTGIRALLDLGSAAAFFTFLSQRPRSVNFVRGYFIWVVAQFTVTLLLLALVLPDAWVQQVWNSQPRALVLLAFCAAFMQNSVWPVVLQAGESQRRTYLVQTIGVLLVTIHVIAVGLLWRFELLGIYAILIALVLEYFVASLFALSQLRFTGDPEPAGQHPFRKYLAYCLPLVPFAGISFANEFTDRWLLQNFGGGVQQAFYAVGAQLSSIALIATSSVLSIFWKEIAEANERGDTQRTAYLYRRVSRLLYFVGAAAAGLLIPWSADILGLLLGSSYVGGAATLSIMLLYPVHQSMGQIGATMLYATERAGLQVMIATVTMLVGVAMTYIVLAPPTARVPGLGLASSGLAIKMVVIQVLSVNALAWTISRVFRWRFDWVHQPIALLGCVAAGWVAHATVVSVLGESIPVIGRLAAGGILYAMLISAILYAAPTLAGLSRVELMRDARRIASLLPARRLV